MDTPGSRFLGAVFDVLLLRILSLFSNVYRCDVCAGMRRSCVVILDEHLGPASSNYILLSSFTIPIDSKRLKTPGIRKSGAISSHLLLSRSFMSFFRHKCTKNEFSAGADGGGREFLRLNLLL